MTTSKRLDKYTSINKKTEVFSDFFTNFDSHPHTHQLARSVNEDAVKKSIRNLLLTNKYERLLDPMVGSNIRRMLFEPITNHTTLELKNHIENTIETYEPRAKIIDLQVMPLPDENTYIIQIVFYVTSIANKTTLNVSLKRVR